MPRVTPLPRHLRQRREKVFGDGNPLPLDRNAKVRVFQRARGLARRTTKGKHYGAITAKALDVLKALLWDFHNAKSGLCFPSYEAIAEKAGCARSTVCEAIHDLEAAGLLTWVNRLVRTKVLELNLFGRRVARSKLIRISNAYSFKDGSQSPCPPPCRVERRLNQPVRSKSEFPSGTLNQEFLFSYEERTAAQQRLAEIAKRRSMEIFGGNHAQLA